MDSSANKKTIHPDGYPNILPAYEDGILHAIMTLPEAYAALKSAISAFLDLPVNRVFLRNNIAPTRDVNAKREQYDINCTVDSTDGRQCNVEMQATPMKGDSRDNEHSNIRSRSIYNLSHLHSNQAGRGLEYSQFAKSYQVMLCNYKVFNFENELVERFILRNENGNELSDDVKAIFIDLTKAADIAKKQAAEMSAIEKWVVFLALSNDPIYTGITEEILKQEEGIAVAYETLSNISADADERARYHSRRILLQDIEHEHAVSRREGREEGREEGLEEGREEGRKESALEIEALKAEIESYKSEMESNKSEMESNKSEIEAYKSEIESYKSEMDSYRIELLVLKSQLEAKAED